MNIDNEYAFPVSDSNIMGMAMRDYFAAKAMDGLLTKQNIIGVPGVNHYEHRIAEMAYQMADAMLEARKK